MIARAAFGSFGWRLLSLVVRRGCPLPFAAGDTAPQGRGGRDIDRLLRSEAAAEPEDDADAL